jgi:hypothetical protein
MLTYMALDWDNQAARSAKLKALADYYHQPDFTAFKMLGADAMAPTKTGGKQKLIINSHGNANVFAGYHYFGRFLSGRSSMSFSQ